MRRGGGRVGQGRRPVWAAISIGWQACAVRSDMQECRANEYHCPALPSAILSVSPSLQTCSLPPSGRILKEILRNRLSLT
jgi:hypothetical protein